VNEESNVGNKCKEIKAKVNEAKGNWEQPFSSLWNSNQGTECISLFP